MYYNNHRHPPQAQVVIRRLAAAALVGLWPAMATALQLVPILSGLASPLFVGHGGDGSNRLFVVEQAGVVRVLRPGAVAASLFLDIRARIGSGGERGLLGLAFHPRFAANGRFFVYYTRAGDGALVIAEYAVSPDPDVAHDAERTLLVIPHPGFANHNGGMLAFGPDGFLYIGVGDGGSGNDPSNNAQDRESLLGKILRIDIDRADAALGTAYAAPADNPLVGAPGRDEIFAWGFRNPWRFTFDRQTGALWVADVGQGAIEEVDAPVEKGGNYGWRVYEGSFCTGNDPALCNPTVFRAPLFEYAHEGGRCSITGGPVYRGRRGTLVPGSYLYGDFCSGEILAWDGGAQRVLLAGAGNIASFGEDEAGEPYVVDIAGTVSRIAGASPCAVDSAGAGAGTPPAIELVEYYHASLDRYFVTWLPNEIASLDQGTVYRGWQRTDLGFRAFAASGDGTAAVCRYYLPARSGESHFYGRDARECAATARLFPEFVLEAAQFMHVCLPVGGACPPGTRPIYRTWNSRPDANHRYTTDRAVRDSMVARGWTAEGEGEDRIIMCGPAP